MELEQEVGLDLVLPDLSKNSYVKLINRTIHSVDTVTYLLRTPHIYYTIVKDSKI